MKTLTTTGIFVIFALVIIVIGFQIKDHSQDAVGIVLTVEDKQFDRYYDEDGNRHEDYIIYSDKGMFELHDYNFTNNRIRRYFNQIKVGQSISVKTKNMTFSNDIIIVP